MENKVVLCLLMVMVYATPLAVKGAICDADRFGHIVTNRIVCSAKLETAIGWARRAEVETGATKRDVAEALNAFILRYMNSESHSRYARNCSMAIWMVGELADDDQLKVLESVSEMNVGEITADAFIVLYQRKAKGGVEIPRVRKMLADDKISLLRKGAAIAAIRRYRFKHPDDTKHEEAVREMVNAELKEGRIWDGL